jgi:hypothetical protein
MLATMVSSADNALTFQVRVAGSFTNSAGSSLAVQAQNESPLFVQSARLRHPTWIMHVIE